MADGPVTERTSRKTWVSVLIAAVIIVGILAVTAIGGTAFFFYRHIQSEPVQSETAAQQFAEARARFTGQKPFIEMRRGEEPVLHREFIASATAGKPLEMLRVLAYDPDNGIDFDADRTHLTLEDLERRGPGLLLDHADRRGSLVLVWTE